MVKRKYVTINEDYGDLYARKFYWPEIIIGNIRFVPDIAEYRGYYKSRGKANKLSKRVA